MDNKRIQHATEKEWCYLTPKARELAKHLMGDRGIEDPDLAVELAVLILGDKASYELE